MSGEQVGPDHIQSGARQRLDRLVGEIPAVGREQLLGVARLPLEQQVGVFRAVNSAVPNPTEFLFELSLAQKVLDPRYKGRGGLFFVDPLINLVERGHRVAVVYEKPQGGVSRHQARFLNKLRRTEEIVVVNPDDPDIIALGIGPESDSLSVQIPGRPGPDFSVEQTDARGTRGLFELYMGESGHPAFTTGKAVDGMVEQMITDEYQLKVAIGTVTQPARPNNQAVMTLDNEISMESANVRFLAIVGVDEPAFLDRGEDEIYLHRPVRVWFNENWQKARVTGFGPHGLVEVRCEERVVEGPRKGFLDGHGLTVGGDSVDLDLRDPSTPERKHPLEGYPHIRRDNCVRIINRYGELTYGWISNIHAREKKVELDTHRGLEILSFDDPMEFIGPPAEDSELQVGGKFKARNWYGRNRIFEIKGVDEARKVVIGEIVSFRQNFTPIAHIFRPSQIELMGDPTEMLQQLPYLEGLHEEVRFRHWGRTLIGKVDKIETLPAFVEVVRETSSHRIRRYRVNPKNLRGEVSD